MIFAVRNALLFGLGVAGVAFASTADYAIKLETRTALDTGIANIHVEVVTPLMHTVDVSYGRCNSLSLTGTHHDIARGVQVLRSSRLVWRVPENSPRNGCLTAWDSETGALVARSTALNLNRKRKRSLRQFRRDGMPIKMNNASGIDSHGPWFDGVAYLEGRNVSQVDVEDAKSKSMIYLPVLPDEAFLSLLMTVVKGLVLSAAGWLV